MKRIISLVLTLALLLLAGCRKDDTTSSGVNNASSEILSSSEEITSSEEIVSSEVSSEETSTETKTESSPSSKAVTASKTESIASKPTVSNNAESKSETSSPANATPTTYFEKHNLKITPISNELCFNNDPNHQCPNDKDIGITVTSVPERFYYSFDVELFDDNFDISKYKAVKYYDYAVNSQKWEDCHMSDVVSFDKYSGKTIDNGTLTKYGWQELIFNDKKIYVMMFNGVDESGYWHIILCPVEYDGAIFAVLGEDKDFGYITSNNCLIEKFIDLENDKYYLFAENN